MNRTHMKIGIALVLAGIPGLQAQELEYSAKVGFVSPYDNLKTLTQKSMGYGIEGGVTLKPSGELGLGIGLVGGYIRVDGAKETYTWIDPDNKTKVVSAANAKAGYVGLDLVYPFQALPLTIRTGPSLATWDVTDTMPPALPRDENAWKMGWRIGAEYRVAKGWSVTLNYQLSQWVKGISPGWFMVSAGYHF